MEVALYDAAHGYYARAARRSGRRGDFFTSVDVGPLFGELIAVQLAGMWALLRDAGAALFDIVEAGAGSGRLARDILDAAAREHPDLYENARVTLVERSAAARGAQRAMLGPHASTMVSAEEIPAATTGVIFANELLDALPVHVVTMTASGLREIYVTEREGRLVEIEGPMSDPTVTGYISDCISRSGLTLAIGARVEVGLEAERWVRRAADTLDRGFLLLFDYGHEARELYSATHHSGTLMSYRGHTARAEDWLNDPGERDLTSHVNLTTVRRAAESAGLQTLGVIDQTYFLGALGLVERLDPGDDRGALKRRLAAKTLVMPGGLGSTMKVMVFAKGVGTPALRGLSNGRLTR